MPCPVCQAPLVDVQATDEPTASRSDFEQRVLDRYPYVIALPYQNMLNEQDGRGRLDLLAYTLQNALKYMGLLVVGEYRTSNLRLPQLNELFKHNLYQPVFRKLESVFARRHRSLGEGGAQLGIPRGQGGVCYRRDGEKM